MRSSNRSVRVREFFELCPVTMSIDMPHNRDILPRSVESLGIYHQRRRAFQLSAYATYLFNWICRPFLTQ